MNVFETFCKNREFEQSLAKSREHLYRVAFAWSHSPDIADDLVQETCAKALRQRKQLRDPGSMGPWLFRILMNTWHDYLRSKKDNIEFDESLHIDEQSPELVNSRYETVRRVRTAMQQLPMGQREVIALVDIERFSYAEVAEILNVPAGTVMSRLCRARRQLKEILSARSSRPDQPAEVVSLRRNKL